MCPHVGKQWVQEPGSPVMHQRESSGETHVMEAVAESPRCNIWWFLLIAGGCIATWMGVLSVKYLELREQTATSQASQGEQYKHILYRLDEIDKKLDKRVLGAKMDPHGE